MSDIATSRDKGYRRRILLVNGAAIVGSTIFLLSSDVILHATVSLAISTAFWISLLLLICGEWLVWQKKYFAATIVMFIGGVGTLPAGLLAIIGAVDSRRLWSKTEAPDVLKITCTNCGYDLRGTPVPRCPECGCLRGFNKTAEELGIEMIVDSAEPNNNRECNH